MAKGRGLCVCVSFLYTAEEISMAVPPQSLSDTADILRLKSSRSSWPTFINRFTRRPALTFKFTMVNNSVPLSVADSSQSHPQKQGHTHPQVSYNRLVYSLMLAKVSIPILKSDESVTEDCNSSQQRQHSKSWGDVRVGYKLAFPMSTPPLAVGSGWGQASVMLR